MTYEEMEKTKPLDIVLRDAGFAVSERCCSRPSCFDLAARKNEVLILVKSDLDIDTFSAEDASELKIISQCISAISLLVGERTREKPLEDDTVYSRYDVSAFTPQTFENIVLRKFYPLIHAGPGGYYVEIDGEAIKRRRQELGLSAGEMAERIGVSRRTLYGYERGMAKASVNAAFNLIYTLGVPIAKPINVFEEAKDKQKCFLLTAKSALVKNKLLRKIFRKFTRCKLATVKRAPFDFVITIPEEKMKIIGGVANDKESELQKRVDEIISVSKIARARSILVTDKHDHGEKDISCIRAEELSKIKNPEDLIYKI